jgi:hypothetical protein
MKIGRRELLTGLRTYDRYWRAGARVDRYSSRSTPSGMLRSTIRKTNQNSGEGMATDRLTFPFSTLPC